MHVNSEILVVQLSETVNSLYDMVTGSVSAHAKWEEYREDVKNQVE